MGQFKGGDEKMKWKARITHNTKNSDRAKVREGKEVYRHPEGRFIVLEFQGIGGKFREAFHPREISG